MQKGIQQNYYNPIQEDILIAGGGPVAGFLGYILAKQFGYTVRIIESHPDLRNPRVDYVDRSNGIVYRGVECFQKIGLGNELNKIGVPIDRKCLHTKDFDMELPIPEWGKKDMICQIIGRKDVTCMLINKMEETGKVKFEFDTRILSVDLDQNIITTLCKTTLEQKQRKFQFILGADGYRSVVRQGIEKKDEKEGETLKKNYIQDSNYLIRFVDIPSWVEFCEMTSDKKKYSFYHNKVPQELKDRYTNQFYGKYKIHPNSLHVWAGLGKNIYLFGLTLLNNKVNVFVCLPEHQDSLKKLAQDNIDQIANDPSKLDLNDFICFDSLKSEEDIEKFVLEKIPQLAALVPDIVEQLKTKPSYKSYTILYDKWFYEGNAAIFGDAAHSMTPFAGSGLSTSLQNVCTFIDILKEIDNSKQFIKNSETRKLVFQRYQEKCFDDTKQAQISQQGELLYPGLAYAGCPKASLYMMVTGMIEAQNQDIFMEKIHQIGYSKIPYSEIKARTDVQYKLVHELIANAKSPQDVDLTGVREKIINRLLEAGIQPKIRIH